MLLIDSPTYKKVLHKETLDLGHLYFFENYLVAEFNEGVNIGYDNFKEAEVIIKKQYESKNFGFISNRFNSFSIVITDASKFNDAFPNLKAYATVTYSSFASKVFEMENHFFKFNRKNFNDLSCAIDWVEETLETISKAN